MKLLINSPAPISRTKETATSAITSKPRSRAPLLPSAAPRPPSFSVSLRLKFDACTTDARAKIRPVVSATAAVKMSTFASIPIESACEIVSGINVFRIRRPAIAKIKPTAAPKVARSTLSVRNCLVRRERLAPSASRSAISFCRTAARARRRFATFAHAIRSTNPTAPSSTSNAGRMSPTTSSCSGLTTVLMRRLVLGYCWARRAAIVFHLRLSLLKGDAGFHPRDDFEVMISARLRFFAGKCNWHPKLVLRVVAAWHINARRHHADDGVTFAIQVHCLPDDPRIGTESPLPQTMAENHDVCSWRIFLRQKSATQARLHA